MFQYQARDKAHELMDKYGLRKEGWKLAFDTAKRRNGACERSTKTIYLSKHYVKLNSEELIVDTILHEIAHALTPNDPGHGYAWKLKCGEMGGYEEIGDKAWDYFAAYQNVEVEYNS